MTRRDYTGGVTKKGYRRIWFQGRQRMEHDVVWEAAHGPIPEGYDVHHRDENKLNNQLENLELLTKLEHKRRHSCVGQREDGVWLKNCSGCHVVKPLDAEHWYWNAQGWPSQVCRPCTIVRATARKQRMREANPRQPRPVRLCGMDGCSRPFVARNLCSLHWQRTYRKAKGGAN